ncbi:glyoxalase family protein [Deinobacterium chartae]|uniref:Glyoxalase family protein n=1 Tax=Deinobacterium chartae TaxID=521158 RepID=A0A841I0S8_9DEIO|nr:ring-cleaving dioxygenase [Deinobacterium chartae]MBB6098823.1 glyoxalase family protein [Deinobacterium chartae]
MNLELSGLHHVTAVTADAPGNLAFYTRVLGMRLVKKTVNQDDVRAYHLFYADGAGSPGSDLTFFDWPQSGRERRGNHTVSRTGLRVPRGSLPWWKARLEAHGVTHGEIHARFGRDVLHLEDPEGQRLALVEDDAPGHPWARSPVPAEHQILGLGPATLSLPGLEPTRRVLERVYGLRAAGDYENPDAPGTRVHVLRMRQGGPAAELHLEVRPELPIARPGVGGVHHIALRVPDDQYVAWVQRLQGLGLPTSGAVDRFYFRSIYYREPQGILIELATDGPGFATDEPFESMGERLSLPPFLEERRADIEAHLKPLE